MENNSSVHIFVEGCVQGVGFRHFVKTIAENLGLTGWVRNRYDDRVEILAQGKENELQKFVSAVHAGPGSALVTNLEIEWIDSHPRFERFSIAASV